MFNYLNQSCFSEWKRDKLLSLKARSLLFSGEIIKAKKIIKTLSKYHKQDPGILFTEGLLFEQIGEIEKALFIYYRCLKYDRYFVPAINKINSLDENSKKSLKEKSLPIIPIPFYAQNKSQGVEKYLYLLIKKDEQDDEVEILLKRIEYFLPNIYIRIIKLDDINSIPKNIVEDNVPILCFFPINEYSEELNAAKYFNQSLVHTVDFRAVSGVNWNLAKVANYFFMGNESRSLVKQKFLKMIQRMKAFNYQKAYVFGTGPSLDKAINHDWGDGYRIVCNSIVKDKKLWKHISPHIITALDGDYFLGHEDFARKFRKDLYNRLDETDTCFIYDALFEPIIFREYGESDRMIPVAYDWNISSIDYDMTNTLALNPIGANVLTCSMLPIACTLSKNIYLWGFDGKSPNSKNYWDHSSNHFYKSKADKVIDSNPNRDRKFYFNYAQQFDNKLEMLLIDAEGKSNYSFYMMHDSYTKSLQRRRMGINQKGNFFKNLFRKLNFYIQVFFVRSYLFAKDVKKLLVKL